MKEVTDQNNLPHFGDKVREFLFQVGKQNNFD